jgi:hypothetical protein
MSIKRIVLSTTLSLLSQHALAAVPSNPVTVAQMHIAINKAVASISPGETYTAGTAISIINNIISGAYTPGAGIGISGAEISATPYTVSNGLTLDSSGFVIQGYQAGTNITIDTGTNPSTINATGGTTVAVGDLYQGGIVYYVDATGQHGLAVSLVEQSQSEMGGGVSTYFGSGNGVGAGVINTTMMLMVGEITTGLSSITSSGYESDGTTSCATPSSSPPTTCFGGWYMGSAYEYQLIQPSLATIINPALLALAGSGAQQISTTADYWTSNVASGGNNVYTVNISTAAVQSEFQDNTNNFRGIRQF